MASEKDYQSLLDRIGALRETLTNRLAPDLIQNPQLADVLTKQLDDLLDSAVAAHRKIPPPPHKGLASLIAIAPGAATQFRATPVPSGAAPYHQTLTPA